MLRQDDDDQLLIKNGHNNLYGRSEELKTLKKIYENAKNPDVKGAQFVFVAGESGIGKTATISSAFHDSDSLYGAAKFDQHTESRPFTAIIHAFGEICNRMALRKQEYSAILQEGLQEDEIITLAEFIPDLENVVEKTGHLSFQLETSTKQGLERLRYCLRLFLRLVSRKERPVVLFLDDIQWVGQGALSILQFLFADHELKHCVFVGAYRSREVDPDHSVALWLEKFKRDSPSSLTHISLSSLDVDTLSTFLSDSLGLEDVGDLAELIHARTHGNIFHVLQLVGFLKSKKLLKYNMIEFKWTWDIDKVRDETVVAENVLEILRVRFQALPSDVQTLLKLSACLGFRFDRSFLEMVAHVIDPPLRELSPLFDSVVKDNLIEHLNEGRYKFCHDSIHQAALHLMDEPERFKTHLKIGESLYQTYGNLEKMDVRTVFLVTDQIKLGIPCLERDRRLDVSKLSLEAGKQAAKLCAFSSAADYFQMGISLLEPELCWIENYELAMQLHTFHVQMCLNEGKNEFLQENINYIMSKSRCVEDCLPLHFVSAELLLRVVGDYKGHVEMCFDLIKTLNGSRYSLPSARKRRSAIKITRKKFMSVSDEEILSLPVIDDVRTKALIRLAFEIYFSLHQLGQHDLLAISICKAVETTLEVGLCPYGSLCIAMFGNVIMSELDDVDTACRCGHVGIRILNKLNAKSLHAALVFQISLCSHWREPFTKLVDSFVDGYTQGFRSGEIFYSFQNVTVYMFTYYHAGLELGPLLKDIENFIELFLSYGISQMLVWLPMYQFLLNLTGDVDDIHDLSRGKALDIRKKVGREELKKISEMKSTLSFTLEICFFCEAFDKATNAYEKLKEIKLGLIKSSAIGHSRIFFFSLICIQNAKISRFNLRARREARVYFNIIRDCVKNKGAINLAHRYIILQAEMMTLSRRKETIDHLTEAFDKAIIAASRAGFIQDAALAAQLASRAVDGQKSMDYFNQALELYKEWGAYGLVDFLIRKSKNPNGFTVFKQSSERPGLRSRERYDSRMFDSQRASDLC